MSGRLTVVIPVHNGARYLPETICSLQAQTLRDFRLLCIDDASDDDSAAVIETAGVELMPNERRLGLAKTWNRAVALADSEYLVLAHQDDVYDPAYAETMLDAIASLPRAFAVHCKVRTIDDGGRAIAHPAAVFKERFWPDGNRVEREPALELAMLQRGNYVVAPTVMFRRSAVLCIGPFDERYEFVTDWEYWMRGVLAGFTLGGVPSRLVAFRRHEQTATRAHERTLRRYEEELDLLRRIAQQRPGPHAYRAIENTILADFVERLASGDRDGARRLIAFGRHEVPDFSALRAGLMRTILPGGRLAGRALRAAELTCLRFSKP